jgi:molecular chaperone DnaJ
VAVEIGFAEAATGVLLSLEVARFSRCQACGGTGGERGHGCAHCQGRGVRRAPEPVRVAIPAGVDTGMQLRVPDEGSAGPFGGPRGDLIVSTRVREHPFFQRKGDSVHCDVPVTVWEALRGARIRVPTPLGEAALVVPPGTTAGQMFRLRGHGLPRLTGETAGDLFVTVRVEVPGGLDARTDELVRELERLLPMAPRAGLERYAGGAV